MVEVVEQRRFEGFLYGIVYAVVPGAAAASHQGHPAVFHHGLHIGEVHIDIPRLLDDLYDAAYCRGKDFVGFRECFLHEQVAVVFVEFLVVDDEEAVDAFFKFVYAVNGF